MNILKDKAGSLKVRRDFLSSRVEEVKYFMGQPDFYRKRELGIFNMSNFKEPMNNINLSHFTNHQDTFVTPELKQHLKLPKLPSNRNITKSTSKSINSKTERSKKRVYSNDH